jgi:hypothetical protein
MAQFTHRRRLLVLGICCMSLFIVAVDNTIVNIALPPSPAISAGRPRRGGGAQAARHRPWVPRLRRAGPGLYRTAFCRIEKETHDTNLGMLESPAYALLAEVLDELLAAGRMHPDRRLCGEAVAWSAAHGLAMLIIDGPLAYFDADVANASIEATLDVLAAGFAH